MSENVEIVNNVTEQTDKPARTIIRRTQLRHREVISRLIYHNQTIKEIANELGFSESGLGNIVKSPLFQIELQKELNIKQKIERDNVLQSVANNGAAKLHEAVTTGKMTFEERDKNGNVIRRTEKVLDGREIVAIAHDALDRTGHKPIQRTVEATIDLGRMILNAHQDNDDVMDAELVDVVE